MTPVPTPISPTVGAAAGVSVFGGQGVGLQRSSCRSATVYATVQEKTEPPQSKMHKGSRKLRMENKILRDFSAIHRKDVRPRGKYTVIFRHRSEYPVSVICKSFEVSQSESYDYVKRVRQPKTFKKANDLIDRNIHFYSHERIQNKTGVAQLKLRHST